MLGFLPNIGPTEILVVLAVALLIFGPGKLPEVGKALGRTINEFKRASRDVQKQINEAIEDEDKKA
ncbi:MAG: twin-arginine translocase TatA/TatE family subunit [Clostridia bacterium]|nr:twin-arginine translocase TatA/TatE family subunit [Clostridia bacterium]